MGRAPGWRSPGDGMGRLAHSSVGTSTQIADVDCLVVSRHGGNAGRDGLALQQHGQERLRCSSLSHHEQRHLATVSDPRFVLRPACHRFDDDFGGRNSDTRVGAAKFSSVQKRLTSSMLFAASRTWIVLGCPVRSSSRT